MSDSSERPLTTSAKPRPAQRIESIDVLRGIVIVLMALDHVRDYFSGSHFNPLDPQRTDLALYLTRWVTHLCAPIFVLLAGVSIHLQLAQTSRAAVSMFLLKRGLWLVLLEFTAVNILWSFQLGFESGFLLQVIWAIGVCMVAMAALVHLPVQLVGALGLLLIGAHNLADSVAPATYGSLAPLWMALHAGGELGPVYFGYPILPWLGIMAVGYALGALYVQDLERRRRSLWTLGIALLTVFVVVRGINGYGDPKPWVYQDGMLRTAFSFFDVDKYPPSLAYTTITLGIGLLALAALERSRGRFAQFFRVYGKVPLFAYLVHIAIAHALAGFVGFATGHGISVLTNPFWKIPKTWGFGLLGVYLAWFVVLALLYPLCRWYGRIKGSGRYRWMAYL